MTERKIKIQLYTNRESVTPDYVFETLFLTNKKANNKLPAVAKEIVIKAAKRGELGLAMSDWADVLKELNISEFQYFFVLRTLKNAGILTKSRGRYYINRDFNRHLSKMSSAMGEFYSDLGVKL